MDEIQINVDAAFRDALRLLDAAQESALRRGEYEVAGRISKAWTELRNRAATVGSGRTTDDERADNLVAYDLLEHRNRYASEGDALCLSAIHRVLRLLSEPIRLKVTDAGIPSSGAV